MSGTRSLSAVPAGIRGLAATVKVRPRLLAKRKFRARRGMITPSSHASSLSKPPRREPKKWCFPVDIS